MTKQNLEDLKNDKQTWGSQKEQLFEWQYWGQVFSSVEDFKQYLDKVESIDFEDLQYENNKTSDSTELAQIASKQFLESSKEANPLTTSNQTQNISYVYIYNCNMFSSVF